MKELQIDGRYKRSRIIVGEKVENVLKYIDTKNIVIITDTNVNYYYSSVFPDVRTIVIESGERSKSFETISDIIEKLIEFEVDRSWFVLGIGGGVVCDIAGFIASLYMRGLNFGYIATSLLCQVDASVGGKTGINFKNLKNLIGVINQPEFVICDIDTLKTLPEKEIKCGIAEIIKHALIQDIRLFDFIEANLSNIKNIEKTVFEELVFKSIEIKLNIVRQDEFDKNIRRKLNFGHTFGHAIETLSELNHGEAISVGIMIAARISLKKAFISKKDIDLISNMLDKFKLPTSCDLSIEKLMQQIKLDKKREGNNIDFILLNKIGNAQVYPMSFDEIKNLAEI